jgi:hypothetical protein
VPVTQSSNARG